jgi:hypothetical protein
MACNDLPQPVTLSWDSLVHSQPQLRFDFLKLRPHAVAPGLSLKLEGSPAGFAADEGEAQKLCSAASQLLWQSGCGGG